MFRFETVTEASKDIERIKSLFDRSFPPNERKPAEFLLNAPHGAGELVAFYDDELFCGFMHLLRYRDIAHILYFAVDDALRGRGYGTMALDMLRKTKPGVRLIADVEVPCKSAVNCEQRRKRWQFYIRGGYSRSGIAYRWRGEAYEILVCGGSISGEEFAEFWRQFE